MLKFLTLLASAPLIVLMLAIDLLNRLVFRDENKVLWIVSLWCAVTSLKILRLALRRKPEA